MSLLPTAYLLLVWVAVWTIIGAILMAADKLLALRGPDKTHSRRISERTLHETALVGGFLGIVIGAKVFHHKTSKTGFWAPVVVAVFLWIILFIVVFRYQPQIIPLA